MTPNTNYLNAIDGDVAESVFWENGAKSTGSNLQYYTQYLNVFKNAGKTVFTIDYPPDTDQTDIEWCQSEAKQYGYIEYCGTSSLNQLCLQP